VYRVWRRNDGDDDETVTPHSDPVSRRLSLALVSPLQRIHCINLPSISRWDGPLASAFASARRSLYQSQEWLVSAAALLQLSSRLLVTTQANTSRPRHHTSDTTHSHNTLCSAHTHSTLRCRPLRHNRGTPHQVSNNQRQSRLQQGGRWNELRRKIIGLENQYAPQTRGAQIIFTVIKL
jgi:hypothetical protein